MNLTNKLLVATPDINDKRFSRAVILICEHSDQGALGININMPSEVQFNDILAGLQMNEPTLYEPEQYVYEGGPVNTQCGFILHRTGIDTTEFESSIQVAKNIRLTTSKDIIKAIAKNQLGQNWLMALGCATWDAGQLEQEMAEHVWLLTDPNDAMIFNHNSDRWDLALKLIGVQPYQLSADIGHA